jgi:plasmid stabilization system protein ParE
VEFVRLPGGARRSIAAAIGHSILEFGPQAAVRYAALVEQAIADFAERPSAVTVRRLEQHPPDWNSPADKVDRENNALGEARKGRTLLRYDLVLSREHVPPDVGRVTKPRHFIVGRLDGNLLRILFIAHDSMKPENVLRRSRQSNPKDD